MGFHRSTFGEDGWPTEPLRPLPWGLVVVPSEEDIEDGRLNYGAQTLVHRPEEQVSGGEPDAMVRGGVFGPQGRGGGVFDGSGTGALGQLGPVNYGAKTLLGRGDFAVSGGDTDALTRGGVFGPQGRGGGIFDGSGLGDAESPVRIVSYGQLPMLDLVASSEQIARECGVSEDAISAARARFAENVATGVKDADGLHSAELHAECRKLRQGAATKIVVTVGLVALAGAGIFALATRRRR